MERHLKILHTVAQAVNRSLDVDEVLTTALDELTSVTGHETSSLHLISADGTELQLHGARGLSEQLREVNQVLPLGEGVIGRVASTGETFQVADAGNSPYTFPPARDVVKREGIRGFVCVAIHSRGKILGTLALGRRTRVPFDEPEIALLEATAGQIGLALDNARLYSETMRQLEELRVAHAQLIHAEKLSAIGELASGIAHEINNPLTTILGQVYLLKDHDTIDTYVRDKLTVISEETSRAARIVQNLLLFARRYSGERRPSSLSEAAQRVLDLKGYQLEKDGIRVRTQFSPCPPVVADENQIQQVLLNLVQNAHQAMAKHAGERVLTLRAGARGSCAFVDVLDTGPGIPAEHLPRIFDPFFTTKPAGEGSGLGLSVSYGIIAEHNGTLTATNRPEGGACFSIDLPVIER